MIRLEKISKRYGEGDNVIRAAEDVTLEIEEGEIVVITGYSGSGKTTLLNLMGGMTRPLAGSIHVSGRDIFAMTEAELSRFRAETVGFVFQFATIFPTLNALDNVRLPRLFSSRGDDEARARELLMQVGLGDRTQAFHFELSEGQKRRVCIARALMNAPKILLCDEPTGDLDPDTEEVIMNMISKAHAKGATVVMTTHNPKLKSRATRNLRIESGRVFVSAG
ncbi:MAG: ABC transporter ATP-binding protein [Deltaproteobacteria bacterium]|nr:ABC transporter ATP-binding protein [Deltaproteobacteria bacterium]